MRWLNAGPSFFVVSINLVEKKSAVQALSGNKPAIHRDGQPGRKGQIQRVDGDVRTGIQ